MPRADPVVGPVKAWIEPDRWALWRAFPLKTVALLAAAAGAAALGYVLHPAFFVLSALLLLRHAAAEASLRGLFRDGMLHPAVVVEAHDVARNIETRRSASTRGLRGARSLIATLVRLENDGRPQDAVVISRMPRRWRQLPPWGGARAAMVIAGDPPRLRPLSPDFAVRDLTYARRATERIPPAQWQALSAALAQLDSVREGVHPVELGHEPWYGSVRELEVDGSLPAHVDPASPHAWCAGLPSIEEPSMADEERKRVGRLRRRALRDVVLLPALLALASLLLAWDGLPGALRAPLSIAIVFAVPLCLLWMAGSVARARAYGRDLRAGRVLRFAGALSNFDSLALDRDLALLARRGVFAPEPGIEQDIVVLKDARELLHANGKWAPPGLTLHVSEIAAPPEDPIKLSLPSELQFEHASALAVARRRLSEAELVELGKHVRRLRQPGVALLLLTPFALSVLLAWSEHDGALAATMTSAPIVLGMWLFAAYTYWRRLRFAARLRKDTQLGWVITVDHGIVGPGRDPELPARGVESLLHARLDWTVNRRPASWRRFAR